MILSVESRISIYVVAKCKRLFSIRLWRRAFCLKLVEMVTIIFFTASVIAFHGSPSHPVDKLDKGSGLLI
jgi:hypothetical protein